MATIVRDNITIHYKNDGERTNPALVMMHGFGNNSQNWYDLGYVDILKQHFYLIMLDVRGFGESDKPLQPEAYTLENIAQDALAVLDAEHIDKAFYYGSSVGAVYGYYLATHHQDRFNAFIFQGNKYFGHGLIISHDSDGNIQTHQTGLRSISKIVSFVDMQNIYLTDLF